MYIKVLLANVPGINLEEFNKFGDKIGEDIIIYDNFAKLQ